jgi:hypothetical protein
MCHLAVLWEEVHWDSERRLCSHFLEKLGHRCVLQLYSWSLYLMSKILFLKRVEQDVQDCLMALDYVIKEGLINAYKVAVVGISHGGFLSTHLIGQVSILQSSNHGRHLLLAPFFSLFLVWVVIWPHFSRLLIDFPWRRLETQSVTCHWWLARLTSQTGATWWHVELRPNT